MHTYYILFYWINYRCPTPTDVLILGDTVKKLTNAKYLPVMLMNKWNCFWEISSSIIYNAIFVKMNFFISYPNFSSLRKCFVISIKAVKSKDNQLSEA